MNEYDSIGDLAHREDAIGHREPAESPDIELHNNPQHQNAPAHQTTQGVILTLAMDKIDGNHVGDTVDDQQCERGADEVAEHEREERERFPQHREQRIHLESHPARIVYHHPETHDRTKGDKISPKQLDATYNFQFHDIQSKKLFRIV